MSEQYSAPSGPPPPQVPPGWKAQYNPQYQEWFYVNLHTKQSQWERPTSPAHAPSDTKRPLDSNNPYNSTTESDAALAARLQAEEDARARASHSPRPDQPSHGSNSDYYGQPPLPPGQNHNPQQQPPGIHGGYPGAPNSSDAGKPHKSSGPAGFLGKLVEKVSAAKAKSDSQHSGGAGGYGYSQHGGGYPQQQQQHSSGLGPLSSLIGGGRGGSNHGPAGFNPFGGSHGGGGHSSGGFGGFGGHGGGGHYGSHAPPRKSGMGAGGAAALGVGGGMLGGMALANAMDGDDHYHEGGGGYDEGGDYGGGDFDGGGDFGGD